MATETPTETAPRVRPHGNAEVVLEVAGLQTYRFPRLGIARGVARVSFSVHAGETLAIVGESGCGKTMTSLSLMRLVPNPPGRIAKGKGGPARMDLLALDGEQIHG